MSRCKVAKGLNISPGIIILLTVVVCWVLSSVDYLSVMVGVVFAKTMTSLLIMPSLGLGAILKLS